MTAKITRRNNRRNIADIERCDVSIQRFTRSESPTRSATAAALRKEITPMRPMTSLLSVALFAAGITGAQANLTLPVDQEIGTLTCQTRTANRLTGSTPLADCTFVSDRDGATQTYVAILGKRPQSSTLSWRVMTRNGVERSGILAGSFSDPAEWQVAPHLSAAMLIGQSASLRPILAESQAPAKVAKSLAGVELIAKATVASR